MAEARQGSAMRTYQLLLVLGAGLLIGRFPLLVQDSREEREGLMAALGSGAAASAPAPYRSDAELARMAAEIAARVSHETVARLIEAGWAPRGEQRLVVQQIPMRSLPATETVVRLIDDRPDRQTRGWEILPADTVAQALPPPPAPQGPAVSPPRPDPNAHALADAGYRALRSGDRADAARLLAAALAADPAAPQAGNWKADLNRLQRHWALSFYTLARDGAGDPLAASPVLGGGQSGGMLAYRIDPLAKTPVSLFGRVAAAAGTRGAIDRETAEAAIGVRVEPLKGIPVAFDVERRFALGTMSRNAWSARVSGGATRQLDLASLPFQIDGWGEAGVVGFHARPDLYAGGQLRAGTPLAQLGRTAIDVGAGSWAAVQRGWGITASRVDVGPSARFRIQPWTAYAQLDYRARVAGNANPGSGPVVTIAADF